MELFLSHETMKLLRSTKKDVDQDEDGKDVPKLESVEVALVHLTYSITIINKHLKYYLVWYQINSLFN